MLLMKVVRDDTMAVPGFERRTFVCSACHDVERRLIFVRPMEQVSADAVPVHAAPPIAPASAPIAPTPRDEPHVSSVPPVAHEAAAGLLRRMFARLLGG
jgi:hypothetical protein